MWFTRVVFPAPKNPVITVIGIFAVSSSPMVLLCVELRVDQAVERSTRTAMKRTGSRDQALECLVTVNGLCAGSALKQCL